MSINSILITYLASVNKFQQSYKFSLPNIFQKYNWMGGVQSGKKGGEIRRTSSQDQTVRREAPSVTHQGNINQLRLRNIER